MNPFIPPKTRSKRSVKKVKAKELRQQLKRGKIPENIGKVFLLRQLKYELNELEADKILDQLDESTYDFVIGHPIADNYSQMCKDSGVYNNDLHTELIWIVRFLEEFSDELNAFVGLEQLYDKALLLGNYDEAKVIIEQIEQTITFSNWTIQQKLIIAEFEKGFKSNKKLLSNLLSDNNSSVTNFLSNYTSIRLEKNISTLQYDNILKDYMDALDENILDFVKFKVDYFKTFKYEDFGSILSIDSRQAIIDQYISFKQISSLLLCQKETLSKHKLGTVRQCVARIINLIEDPELRVLGTLCDALTTPKERDFNFLDLADLYTKGNYTEAIVYGKEIIKANPKSFHAIELYCNALIYANQEPTKMAPTDNIIDYIISLLHQLLKKDQTFTSEVYTNIYKLVHQFGNHPLTIGLYYVLTSELPFRFQAGEEIDMFKYYLSCSQTLNPALYQFVEPRNRKKYSEYLLARKSSSSTIDLITTLTQPILAKPDESFSVRRLKYFAIVLENRKKYDESLAAYELIFASEEFKSIVSNINLKLDILTGKFNCLIRASRFQEALDIEVQALLENEKFEERFYNPHLLHLLTNTDNEDLITNINLPIYLAFYKTNIEGYDLYVGYDNFLESNTVSTPKEYIQKLDTVTFKDICFLEKVCTHEVLHSSPSFENQEELDLERLEISALY